MTTTEHTINDALANILRKTRRAWAHAGVVRSENSGSFLGNERPDILIVEPNTPPIVIETEVLPAVTVEKEARSRLGRRLRSNAQPVYSSLSVRLPVRLRKLDGDRLSDALRAASDIQFALHQGESADGEVSRWPSSGWLTGGVADLSAIVQQAAVPPKVIEQATQWFVGGISEAAAVLSDAATQFEGAMQHICEILHQEDSEQTRRMAMTIVANALIFHETLANGKGPLASIRPLDTIRNGTGRLSKTKVIKEWERILEINYWPIFDVAKRIVAELPTESATRMLEILAETGSRLLSNRLTRSHDITGAVFQKLIADRKFLAAFYTTPPSAVLLANLALRSDRTPRGGSWGLAKEIESLRIADFACGTGTLLSATYHLISQFHELDGGDSRKVHPRMMADVLVGCDVMPAAAHLTASMLSSVHPDVTYTKSRIIAVPYGMQSNGQPALGSLDMLREQGTFSVLSGVATAPGSQGNYVADTWVTLPRSTFDVVVMNPPFTRATAHEGKSLEVLVPMFAAFGSKDEEQRAMSKAFQKLSDGTSIHGNAGEASAFLVLAHDKLQEGGRLALVMPLSLLGGQAWERSRSLLRRCYSDLTVVTIAGSSDVESSFSADTGMAECIVVGTKNRTGSKRATFAVLESRPDHALTAAEIARLLRRSLEQGVAKLEGRPLGGTPLSLGEDGLGTVIDAPLPEDDGPWPATRIRDLSLAQCSYELATHGRVWLPGESRHETVPFAKLGTLATIGPCHRDINEVGKRGGSIRGPFELRKVSRGRATYPVLWAHDAEAERAMIVLPDFEGHVRTSRSAGEQDQIRRRADTIWSTASLAHFNTDFRFNSQSLSVACTEAPAIGGRAWPSVCFDDPAHAKAFTLWSNTTLGLMMHWWVASKQQGGRGTVTRTAIPDLPTLDVRKLDTGQLASMVAAFDEFGRRPLRPFNEVDSDAVRALLDHRVLGDILGLACASVRGGALALLRQKLSAEPSIAGSKKRFALVPPVDATGMERVANDTARKGVSARRRS